MTTGVEQEGTRELADILETVEARTLLEAAQATGSITTDDVALFISCVTGPGIPGDANCPP